MLQVFVSQEGLWIRRLTGSSMSITLPDVLIMLHFFGANLNFLFQVATANLAWASVAIHQVQVSKPYCKIPPSTKNVFVCYDLGSLSLFWCCFNGGNPPCSGSGLSLTPVQSTRP